MTNEERAAAAELAAAADKRKKVKARVIFAGAFGPINSVALVDKADASHPDLDTDPGAVAYAESLVG